MAVVGIQHQLEVDDLTCWRHDGGEVGAGAIVRSRPHDAEETRREESRSDFFTDERVGAEPDCVWLAIAHLNQLVRATVGHVVPVNDLDDHGTPRHRYQGGVVGRDFDRHRHHLIERGGADPQHIAAWREDDPAAVLAGGDSLSGLIDECFRLVDAARHGRYEHRTHTGGYHGLVGGELLLGGRSGPAVERLGGVGGLLGKRRRRGGQQRQQQEGGPIRRPGGPGHGPPCPIQLAVSLSNPPGHRAE